MEICTYSSIIPVQILRKIMEVEKTDGKQIKEEESSGENRSRKHRRMKKEGKESTGIYVPNFKEKRSRNTERKYESFKIQQRSKRKVKVKPVPLQAWTGPEGSRKLRFPRFRDNGTGWW
jgi:hypothetical protein